MDVLSLGSIRYEPGRLVYVDMIVPGYVENPQIFIPIFICHIEPCVCLLRGTRYVYRTPWWNQADCIVPCRRVRLAWIIPLRMYVRLQL